MFSIIRGLQIHNLFMRLAHWKPLVWLGYLDADISNSYARGSLRFSFSLLVTQHFFWSFCRHGIVDRCAPRAILTHVLPQNNPNQRHVLRILNFMVGTNQNNSKSPNSVNIVDFFMNIFEELNWQRQICPYQLHCQYNLQPVWNSTKSCHDQKRLTLFKSINTNNN